MTESFVRGALEAAGDYPVRFRMHPRNRDGFEIIQVLVPHCEEPKELDGSFEEHLFESPRHRALGSYSTALMSKHHLVVDEAGKDPDWQQTAGARGIPIFRLADFDTSGDPPQSTTPC